MILPSSICRDCMTNIHNLIPFIRLCKDSVNQWNRITEFFSKLHVNNKVKSLYIAVGSNINVYKDSKPTQCKNNKEIMKEIKLKINRQKYYSKRLVKFKDCVEKSRFKCPECSTLFKNIAMFNHHLLNLKIKCCQHCHEIYPIEKYKNHLRVHNVTTFSCNHCKYVFEKFSLLKKHMQKYHKGLFKCPDCDKCFCSEKNLSAHGVKHKFHICPKCNQKFSNKICFLSHKKMCKTDDVFSLYICDICNKQYKSRGALVNHITYNHMKGRRFQCDLCGKTFNSNAHLKEHGNTHVQIADRYICVCKAKFSSRRGYVRHLKKHTG